jgi:dihydroneopterin aldolase
MKLDRIHITDLSVQGILGIKPDERVNPQEILVNATTSPMRSTTERSPRP